VLAQLDAAERERLMAECVRVLKTGGRIALVDFIFTRECVRALEKQGADVERTRDASPSFWVSAILNLGAVQTFHMVGTKRSVKQRGTA
jgi:hypothetical protein